MPFFTHLFTTVKDAGLDVQYDEKVKEILSNKQVLARILQTCTTEFEHYDINTIIDCIEPDIQINKVMLRPGKTAVSRLQALRRSASQRITGMPTNDRVENEGEVRFDILFFAYTPDKKRVKLIINVEAQKDFYPGYELVPRAIYYLARMLSAQMHREFSPKNYDDIKKVYSIWICMDVPRKLENGLIRYSINSQVLHGSHDMHQRFDLAAAVFVLLPSDTDNRKGTKLHQMLTILLSKELSQQEKTSRLTQEFEMQLADDLEEGILDMCNLSQAIREDGRKEALRNVVLLMLEANEPLEKIIQYSGLTRQEIEDLIQTRKNS